MAFPTPPWLEPPLQGLKPIDLGFIWIHFKGEPHIPWKLINVYNSFWYPVSQSLYKDHGCTFQFASGLQPPLRRPCIPYLSPLPANIREEQAGARSSRHWASAADWPGAF